MNDLDLYYQSFYDEADFFILIRKIFFVAILILLVLSMFIEDQSNKDYVYYIMGGLFFLQIFTTYFKYKIDSLYHMGITLQKCDLIAKTIPNSLDSENILYLKNQVTNRILKRISKKLLQRSSDSESHMNYNQLFMGVENLKKNIHENSYVSSCYYKYSYDFKFIYFGGTVIIFIFLPLIFLLPSLRFDSNLFFPRLVLTILSLGIIYEFFDEIIKTKRTYKMMSYVDRYITTHQDIDCMDILNLFSTYNEAKLITPDIPKYIYKQNRQRVNDLWEEKKRLLNY